MFHSLNLKEKYIYHESSNYRYTDIIPKGNTLSELTLPELELQADNVSTSLRGLQVSWEKAKVINHYKFFTIHLHVVVTAKPAPKTALLC